MAGNSNTVSDILVLEREITDQVIKVLVKYLKGKHNVLKKEFVNEEVVRIFDTLTGICMMFHPSEEGVFGEQAKNPTLSSRAFYIDKFPVFVDNLTSMFGYNMVLPMDTDAKGLETVLKLARKWGYEKKRIPKDEAIIVSCCDCFHGCILATISMSSDNEATHGFRPLLRGHLKIDFGNAIAFEKSFKGGGDRLVGPLFELIQGETRVIIPPDGYLKVVMDLYLKYNIFVIADEK